VAIATVLFPAISRLAARGDLAGVRDTVSGGVRQIFFMLVPASAFLLVLAEPVTRLVFQYGEFDAESTLLTSEALVFFAVGLVFNGASLLVIRAFFSLQLPWIPTKVALLGVVLNAVLNAVLYQPLGVGGIPLASSLASIVTFLVMLRALERQLGGLGRADMLDGVARTVLAGLFTALLAWASWRVIDDALGRSLPAQMLSLSAALLAAVAAHLSASQAMNLRELGALTRLVRPLR
jgi:putative peptidoglycan lipid II flippase